MMQKPENHQGEKINMVILNLNLKARVFCGSPASSCDDGAGDCRSDFSQRADDSAHNHGSSSKNGADFSAEHGTVHRRQHMKGRQANRHCRLL
jgi:hypothetical protein